MQPYEVQQQPQVVVVPSPPARDRSGAEMAMLVILFVLVLANLLLTIYLARVVYGVTHVFG